MIVSQWNVAAAVLIASIGRQRAFVVSHIPYGAGRQAQVAGDYAQGNRLNG